MIDPGSGRLVHRSARHEVYTEVLPVVEYYLSVANRRVQDDPSALARKLEQFSLWNWLRRPDCHERMHTATHADSCWKDAAGIPDFLSYVLYSEFAHVTRHFGYIALLINASSNLAATRAAQTDDRSVSMFA
jgi:hypothetical protein